MTSRICVSYCSNKVALMKYVVAVWQKKGKMWVCMGIIYANGKDEEMHGTTRVWYTNWRSSSHYSKVFRRGKRIWSREARIYREKIIIKCKEVYPWVRVIPISMKDDFF